MWAVLLLVVAILAGLEILKLKELSSLPGLHYLPTYLSTPLTTQSEHQIIITLAAVISGFSILFIFGYVGKALIDAFRLFIVTLLLKRSRRKGRMEDPASDMLNWHWWIYPLFSRLWREFAESLHRQPHPENKNDEKRVLYRATVPSELVFSLQTLVDVPLKVEFFRHLPGILTGAGIVSTFAGILFGLTEFNPAVAAELVTQELKNLFVGVSTAFVASFFAIFSAILITITEKLILQWRYSQVVSFQLFLDDCFKLGADSEYLARLVSNGDNSLRHIEAGLEKVAASINKNSDQASALPEGQVAELLPLIERLTTVLEQDRKETIRTMDSAIREGFSAPLRVISRAIELSLTEQSRRQEEIRILENRLAGFGERMDVALGELSRGMHTFQEAIGLLNAKHGKSPDILTSLAKLEAATISNIKESVNDLSNSLEQNLNSNFIVATNQINEVIGGRTNQINAAVTGNGKQIKEAIVSSTNQISEVVAGSGKQVNAAIIGSTNQLNEAITGSGKQINETISDNSNQLKDTIFSSNNQLREALASDNNQIKEAINDNGNQLNMTVERGTNSLTDLLNDERHQFNSTVEIGINRIKDIVENDSGQLKDILDGGVNQIIGAVEQGNNQINAAVDSANNQLKHVINESTQQIITATTSQTYPEIIAYINSANTKLEQSFGTTLRDLETKTQTGLQGSTDKIVTAIGSQLAESIDGTRPDPLPSQQLLTEFRDHLASLINSLTVRISKVEDKVAMEQMVIEGHLNRLDLSIKTESEQQDANNKAHIEGLIDRTQEKLDGELRQLSSGIHRELGQLLSLIREASGTISSHLDRQSVQLATNEQQYRQQFQELAKQQEAGINSSLEKINQNQELTNKERADRLLDQLLSSSNQLVDRVQSSVRTELLDTSRAVTDSIRQARDEQSRETVEMTERILSTVSDKMSSSVSEIASGLNLLRDKVTTEKESLNNTMQGWVNDLTTLNQEESQELARRIKGVMDQVDNRHDGMINVLNQLNQGIGDDLLEMKEKIINSSQESEQKLAKTLTDLGHGVQNTVQRTSEEQNAFIELLSERLEIMRQKLRIK